MLEDEDYVTSFEYVNEKRISPRMNGQHGRKDTIAMNTVCKAQGHQPACQHAEHGRRPVLAGPNQPAPVVSTNSRRIRAGQSWVALPRLRISSRASRASNASKPFSCCILRRCRTRQGEEAVQGKSVRPKASMHRSSKTASRTCVEVVKSLRNRQPRFWQVLTSEASSDARSSSLSEKILLQPCHPVKMLGWAEDAVSLRLFSLLRSFRRRIL